MRHLLAAVCCFAALATSQDDGRARLRGTVIARNGSAWSGARVFLHGRELAGFDAIGSADYIEVRSDQRGRFVARILTDRTYDAWAAAGSGPDSYRVSHPVARVTAGRPVRLVEQDVLYSRVRLRIAGELRGPLSMKITNDAGIANPHLLVTGNPTTSPVVLDQPLNGRTVQLPLLPWEVCRVELFADGRWVYADNVTLARARRTALLASGGRPAPAAESAFESGPRCNEHVVSLTEDVLEIPKPKLVRYRVIAHDGKKLAGAHVSLKLRGKLYPLAKTDGHGRVKLADIHPLPLHQRALLGLDSPELVFSASGEAATVPGSMVPIPIGRDGQGADRLHTMRLPDGRSMTGRLLVAGRPLARVPLIVHRSIQPGSIGQAFLGMFEGKLLLSTLHETDGDGRFEIAHCGKGDVRVSVLLPVAIARDLGGTGAVARLATVADGGLSAVEDWSLGDIEVTELRRLHVKARRPDGARLRNARVVLFQDVMSVLTADRLLDLVTDRRGEVTVVVATRRKLRGIVADDGAFGIRLIAPSDTEVELVAKPALTVSGRVVDPAGKPIADVTVAAQPPKESFHTSEAEEVALYQLTSMVRHRFVQLTDAAGRFKVWMLSRENPGRISLSMPRSGATGCFRTIELHGESVDGLELKFERKSMPATGPKKAKKHGER